MSLTYDEVRVGDIIPELRNTPTLEALVRWAGASGDFTRIHYDPSFATEVAGLPDVVVPGPYKLALLTRMIVNWADGNPGALARIRVRLSRMDQVDGELHCHGRVTTKRQLEGHAEIDCDVWVENVAGERTMTGIACVRIPATALIPA